MLFEPDRHEAFDAPPWSESAAPAAIARIVASACRGYTPDGLWPAHLEDRKDPGEPLRMLYFGAAGVMWALEHLHRAWHASRP
jgi:hypothetical protein